MILGCSLRPMVQGRHPQEAEPMAQEHSKNIDAVPTVLVQTAAMADPAIDETGEASFPASDPPSSWTWDVAGRPPGPATD